MKKTINLSNKCTNTPTSKAIDAYLRSIRKYSTLTAEQETELFANYKTADEEGKREIVEQIVNANQRFIFSVAKQYAKGDDTKLLDYVNEGNIGIINAIERFEPERGYKFISFAVWYIRQAMTNFAQTRDQFLRKSNNAKIGNNIIKIKSEFFQEFHRDPTTDEIKDLLAARGIKIKNNLDLEDVVYNSIDAEWGDDSTFEHNPKFIQSSAVDNDYEKEVEAEDNSNKVAKMLKCLDERSKTVIKQLFGIGYENPLDIEVVAENLGLTTTRVGQIKNAALKKLKEVGLPM